MWAAEPALLMVAWASITYTIAGFTLFTTPPNAPSSVAWSSHARGSSGDVGTPCQPQNGRYASLCVLCAVSGRGGGDEEAEEAARLAREKLQKMWSLDSSGIEGVRLPGPPLGDPSAVGSSTERGGSSGRDDSWDNDDDDEGDQDGDYNDDDEAYRLPRASRGGGQDSSSRLGNGRPGAGGRGSGAAGRGGRGSGRERPGSLRQGEGGQGLRAEETGSSISSSIDALRDGLQRLWDADEGKDVNNPLPKNSWEGAEEAVEAAREAMLAGKRRMVVNVEVVELDEIHPMYDEESLYRFVGALAHGLSVAGRVKVLYRRRRLADNAGAYQEKIVAALEESSASAAAERVKGFDVAFGSTFEDDAEIRDRDAMESMGDALKEQVDEEDRAFVLVQPRYSGDMAMFESLIKLARGRPIVVFNPRFPVRPAELNFFEAVYELRPFVVQQYAIRRDKKPNFKARSKIDRKQKWVMSDVSQFCPKVVCTRRFPADWKLFVDGDGAGYKELAVFERMPSMSSLIVKAQRLIDTVQRETRTRLQQERIARLEQEQEEEWEDMMLQLKRDELRGRGGRSGGGDDEEGEG